MKIITSLFLTDTAVSGIESVMNSTLSLNERLALGLEVTLLGLGTVFAVLIILWAVLSVFRLVFYKPGEPKKITKPIKADDVAVPVVSEAPKNNDEELVAVITAAISVMIDKPQTSFRVVSFKRTASK